MWLKYIFSKAKKVKSIEVYYSLITQSGNEILTISEDLKPEKEIIRDYGDFSVLSKEDIKKIKEITDKFDKRARELLNKFQEKERKKIKQGWMDSGNYIIKCVWDLSIETEWLDFKEFKEWKKK